MDRIGTGFIGATGVADSTKEITLQSFGSPATVTANGNTGATGLDVSSYKEALLFIDITAISGTSPTIQFYVDTYDFNSGKWFQHPTNSGSLTATGQYLVQLTNFGETVRLRWVVGGTTPSVTFDASMVGKS